MVTLSILITERTKTRHCASILLNAFLFWRVFPHAYSIDIGVHKTVFSLAFPLLGVLDVLWRRPWREQWNVIKRKRICVLFRFFGLRGPSHHQKKTCWITAMQLHSPPLDCTDVKEQSRTERTTGEQRLAFGRRNLTSNGIKNSRTTAMWNYTDLPRKVDVLKQFMLCSKAMFKICKNCCFLSTNIFKRSAFCWFRYRISSTAVSNVNIIHTKTIRLSINGGPLRNWPHFYVLRPQGAIHNTIKLNKYNPNDSQGQ